jgi:hypothetical protein
MLRGTPVKSNDGFNWDIMVNWARNRNEVVELAEGLDNYLIASWGPSINARVGEPYGSWNTDGFEYSPDGQRIVGSDGIYNRVVNQTYGTYLPDWTGGILNRFSYKGVNLSVMIDGQKGGQLYSVTNRYGDYSGLLISSVGNNAKGNPVRDDVANGGGVIAEGVVDNGDGTYSPNTTYIDVQTYLQGLRIRREYYLYDASFIKLREMKIGYSFPKKFFGNSPFRGLEIAFVGRNLAILHKNAPNIDPENAYGSGNIQGFENGQHPSTRSLGFSLNVKL